MFDIYKILC